MPDGKAPDAEDPTPEPEDVSSSGISNTPDDRGQKVDVVTIAIDYAIIQHFSRHLYGSPNKAVEELVANSYDAWARRSFVYLPGEYAKDSLLVWDDGESMDLDALHRLWWIAKSPKNDGTDRIEERPGRGKRAIIGKFGIGKLASYALGHRITHLARQNAEFLRVTVDYRGVPELRDGEPEPRYTTPVVKLTEAEARDYVAGLTSATPRAFAEFWDLEHWTLAVVDELRTDVELTPGMLRWVLANGMPYRPDFSVVVNDVDLKPKVAQGALKAWTMANKEVRDRLTADWADARKDGSVDGELSFDNSSGVAIFPSLGEVRAEVSIFNDSLLKGRSTYIDRSYGFFVMVRGRLLNPDDPLLLMHDPSYGTFYRTQFIIHADGLDAELLADREHVQRQSPMAAELAVIQSALYRAARQEIEEQDDKVALSSRSESLLPVQSREHFQDPMTALLLNHDQPAIVDPRTAQIERAPLSADEPLAVFKPDSGGFAINVSHPLFSVLSQRLGGGQKAKEALRALDLLAVADRLLEGHLYDVGLDRDRIDRVMSWRDGLLRSIASRLSGAHDDIIHNVREASYQGSKRFETALAQLFNDMGFVTTRDGASGKKDILVVAPIGEAEYSFTVEAKGSNKPVTNDGAEISGAAAHRAQAGAALAVVVAREFVGFERQVERPAILQECDATNGQVSIATLDVVIGLYQAMRHYSYPLDVVLPLLRVVESPADKLGRLEALRHPTEQFDFRAVLNAIWELQKGEASGDLVAYRSVMQSRSDWKALGFEEFEQRILGLQTLSRGLMLVTRQRGEVVLKQRPDIIAQQIARSLAEDQGDW